MKSDPVAAKSRWRLTYQGISCGSLGAVIASLLFLALLRPACEAQVRGLDETWRWTHFGVADGLPPGQILAICESGDGDTWVLTQDGIFWYDGFTWHQATTTLISEREYVSGNITPAERGVSFCTGGKFFACTHEGIKHIPIVPDASEATVHSAVRIPEGGTLVVADSLLFKLEGGKVSPFPLPGPTRIPVPPYYLLRLHETPGGVWAVVADGIYKLAGSRWVHRFRTQSRLLEIIGVAENASGSGILAVQFDNARTVEFRTWQNNGPLVVSRVPQSGYFLSSLDISPQGVRYALLPSGGILLHDGQHWSLLSPLPKPLQGAYLLRTRANGDIWVAAPDGLRLCRLSSTLWTFWHYEEGDRRNYINGLASARDGSIWLATSGGVGTLTPDGTLTWTTQIDGQSLDILTGVMEDKAGHIWISSGGAFNGAYRWDGQRWKHFGRNEGLFDTPIHRIMKDRQGRIWFGSIASRTDTSEDASGAGAAWFDGNTFHHITTHDGLLSGRVYAVAQARDGSLWFGTNEGLQRLHNGVWTTWATAQGLKLSRVFDVATDNDGNVWFAHQSLGVGCLDSLMRLTYHTSKDGLVHDAVYGLTVDSSGGLWATTRGGVGYFSRGIWYAITQQHGLPSAYTWPAVEWGTSMYIGTSGTGLVRLNRAAICTLPTRVRFTSFDLSEEEPVASWLPNAHDGEIPSGIIETRYRTDDTPWSPWSRTRSISLHRFSPGHHTLVVQAKGLLDIKEPSESVLDLDVPYPPYMRLSFVIPVGLLLILLVIVGGVAIARKRRLDREQRETANRLSLVVDAISEGITLSDVAGNFRIFNPRFQQLTGYTHNEAKEVDDFLALICPDEHDRHRLRKAFLDARESGSPQEVEAIIRSRTGARLNVLVSVTAIQLDGRTFALASYRDLTERVTAENRTRESLKEKEVLLKEVHHRVKNNMQVISSLLNLQLYSLKDPTMQEILKESQNRIRSMALIHEKLYQFGQFASVPIRDYLTTLTSSILHTYNAGHVALTLDIGDVTISLDNAMPCGLIVNELFTNALKYAFPEGRRGTVTVSLRPASKTHVVLRVADDGVGLPEGFDIGKTTSLGFQIVQTLTRQLDGVLSVRGDRGTTVELTFPATD